MAQKPKAKRRGRPPMAPDKRKRPSMGFRPTAALREKLEEVAASSGLSMTQEVERRLEQSFQAEAMNYEFFGGEANFKRMRLLGGIINEVELISKKSWVEDENTKTKVIELAGAFLRMFGPELPDAGSQLERGFREHEADRVLKNFVDLALDKRGPKPRKKVRKARAA